MATMYTRHSGNETAEQQLCTQPQLHTNQGALTRMPPHAVTSHATGLHETASHHQATATHPFLTSHTLATGRTHDSHTHQRRHHDYDDVDQAALSMHTAATGSGWQEELRAVLKWKGHDKQAANEAAAAMVGVYPEEADETPPELELAAPAAAVYASASIV